MEEGNEMPELLEVLLIGDSNVGKSKLINRYVNDDFSWDSLSTLGVNFNFKRLLDPSSQTAVRLRLWDTPGNERFITITSPYYEKAHCFVLVVDLEETKHKDVLTQIERHLSNVDRYARVGVPVILAFNKSDLFDKLELDEKAVDQIKVNVSQLNFKFADIEFCSARNGENVEGMFLKTIKAFRAAQKNGFLKDEKKRSASHNKATAKKKTPFSRILNAKQELSSWKALLLFGLMLVVLVSLATIITIASMGGFASVAATFAVVGAKFGLGGLTAISVLSGSALNAAVMGVVFSAEMLTAGLLVGIGLLIKTVCGSPKVSRKLRIPPRINPYLNSYTALNTPSDGQPKPGSGIDAEASNHSGNVISGGLPRNSQTGKGAGEDPDPTALAADTHSLI